MDEHTSNVCLAGEKVFIVSRCAWTLYNFRYGLIRAIQRSGANVVAVGAGGDGFEAKLRNAGIEFRHIPVAMMSVSPSADVRLFVGLVQMIRAERPRVVHSFTIKPAIYATLAAWFCRVPVRVVTVTGLGHAFTSARTWLTKLVSGMYALALARAHRVYFQNSSDRELFVERGIVTRDRVRLSAGSGVDLGRFSVVPLPYISNGGTPTFLMIARLIREKGIIEYLAAAEMVRTQHPSARFYLLGGVDTRNPTSISELELEALKRSSVVQWLGESDDVRSHIAMADVMVLPSYREGIPRTLLEGAAMGRPAITSDVPGCRDVVEDGVTGRLVQAKDPAALAAAMISFIENQASVDSMGAAARKRVVADFDESSVASSTIADYAKLLRTEIEHASTTIAS